MSTFEHVSHQQITKYSKKTNVRSRKKLEIKTLYECFYEQISVYGIDNILFEKTHIIVLTTAKIRRISLIFD